MLLIPRSTHRIPQAERKREIWVGRGREVPGSVWESVVDLKGARGAKIHPVSASDKIHPVSFLNPRAPISG